MADEAGDIAKPVIKETGRSDLEKLDSRIGIASQALMAMDRYAEEISIGENGAIQVESDFDARSEIIDPDYSSRLVDTLDGFSESNDLLLAEYKRDKNVIDARVINGAVVVVFDSSKGRPSRFLRDKDRGFFNGPTSFDFRDEKGHAQQGYHLGEVGIDLNPDLRNDGVDPTTSLRHEFRHHALSLTDFLITGDEDIGMQSAYRRGRKVALFGDARDRMTTDQAFASDLPMYSELLGRMASVEDQKRVEAQLWYLDELHSSLLQVKDNWFDARQNVYSVLGAKGKHWELVGDNGMDIDSAKRLLAYNQSVWLCLKMTESFAKQSEIGAGQQNLIDEVPKLLHIIGSKIGSARTVAQAERLVGKEWSEFSESEWGKKLLGNERFQKWAGEVIATGWGTEELGSTLGLEDNN